MQIPKYQNTNTIHYVWEYEILGFRKIAGKVNQAKKKVDLSNKDNLKKGPYKSLLKMVRKIDLTNMWAPVPKTSLRIPSSWPS